MLSPSQAALARAVLIHGPISRSALTHRLGLSAASLTRLAKPFIEQGLIVELDDVSNGGIGRPIRPLDVAPGLGTFIGVKLTGDTLYTAVTDVRATLLAHDDRPLLSTRPESVAEQIAAAIRDLGIERPAGVGVSIGGAVEGPVVEFAPFLEWEGVEFGVMLEALVGAPVALENDVVALAEAERWFGPGRGVDGFSVITIGAGIGYAMVVHGEVVRSREAGLGLAGHLPLLSQGPICSEGHRGCAQAVLTSGSIAAQVSGAVQRSVDYAQSLELAAAGDAAAVAVTETAAEALGRFIALSANLTLQPAVVLAGDGIALFDLHEELVRTTIAAERDPRAEAVELFVDRTGFTAWARGAAAVAIQAAFERLELAA